MTNPYSVRLTSRAQKDLRSLPDSQQKRIMQKISVLADNRHPSQFKPLIGKALAMYRVRVGDYRILYDVYDDDQVVVVMRIGHRKDIYRV